MPTYSLITWRGGGVVGVGGEDGTITVPMNPPLSISGMTLQFDLMHRNGGQPIVSRYLASGYSAGQSGMTLVRGDIGIFSVQLTAADTSGLSCKNFAFRIRRTDGGLNTRLSEGFIVMRQ